MTGPEHLRVSLILTVKNEARTLEALFASIAIQTRTPDEVIVVDGGSTDGTLEILNDWETQLPLRIELLPGAGISEGRNTALSLATGDIIAVTDAGVILDPKWLEQLVSPFSWSQPLQPDVVGGFFRAGSQTLFEHALAATTLPDESEIRPSRFLPSSRSVAFRASLARAGLRYPEWLDYCEDLVFDLRLKRAGARFLFRPSAFVWFRPRENSAAFFRQYYLYSRGDGKAGLFFRRHAIRYATYLVLLPFVAKKRQPLCVAFTLLGGAAYMRRPWMRLWRRRARIGYWNVIGGIVLAPWLRVLGDFTKMFGYPAGLGWRFGRYGLRRNWKSIPEQSGTVTDSTFSHE